MNPFRAIIKCILIFVVSTMPARAESPPALTNIEFHILDSIVDEQTFQYTSISTFWDSLSTLYPNSDKVEFLILRSKAITNTYNGDFESALLNYETLIPLGNKAGLHEKVLIEKFNMANCYQNLFQVEKAMNILLELSHEESIKKTPDFLAEIYSGLGYGYELDDDYINALQYYQLSEQIIESSEITTDFSVYEPYSSMAMIYHSINENELTKRYLDKAVDFNIKYPEASKSLGTVYTLYGDYYLKLGDYKKAESYFLQSIEYNESNKELYIGDLINTHISLANLYLITNPLKALPLIDKVIQSSIDLNSEYELNAGYVLKGKYHLIKNQFDSAKEYCLQAYDYLISGCDCAVEHRLESIQCLLDAYKGNKEYEKAFTIFDELTETKQIILNKSRIKDVTRFELTSQFIKKQIQDSLINDQKILLLNKDKEILASKNRNIQIALFASVFLALFSTLGILKLRKQNKVISIQKKDLENLNNIKDQIFAITGHDLQKTVQAFSGLSRKINYLLKKKDYAGLDKLGDQIENNGFSLQKLIDNLLTWALSQKNVIHIEATGINLNSICSEIIQILDPIAKEKRIIIQNNINENIEIVSDRNSLFTILFNVLDNALKYTHENGRIKFDLNKSTHEIELIIKDNGIGIAQDKLKDIFELRKNKSTRGTSGEKGTGLGLHVVAELIKYINGDVNITSKQGQGTSFNIQLPLSI